MPVCSGLYGKEIYPKEDLHAWKIRGMKIRLGLHVPSSRPEETPYRSLLRQMLFPASAISESQLRRRGLSTPVVVNTSVLSRFFYLYTLMTASSLTLEDCSF